MKAYRINRVTLAIALMLGSGAALSASGTLISPAVYSGAAIDFGSVPGKLAPTLDDADMDHKNITLILDTWWWNYQYTDGFKEAIAQFGLTIEQMTENYKEMEARAKNPNDPLFWLKRTLETYPAQQDLYNIPVTEENGVMRDRTTQWNRNPYFLTREYAKAGEKITIKTAAIPAGIACYAAMQGNRAALKGPMG